MADRTFHLGAPIDPTTGDRLEGRTELDPDDLTTHGVIVGMTGSGKTGLGVGLIEEARRAGVPCLVIDPKGDMGNLALTFPELRPTDFEPWIDEAGADGDVEGAAEATAARWRDGLESWGLGPEDVAALAASGDVTIYTPGSTSGVSIDIVGSLRCPDSGWDGYEEELRDEIESFVSSLLGLAGIEADPIADREHVLLANLIEHAWSGGSDMDLELLIGWIVDPPLRKLGVFDLDTFYPKADRTKLAMRLNGLVASPSFQSWMQGVPLDMDLLLGAPGEPRTAVIYLAHLSDSERQFVVTLVLSRLVTWMRGQSGTGSLRALVYMDEVFGYVPPTAEPPAKKPILTILKQARAFGVGMVLSTQNPVDLDYKAMSNAGTWMVGRLQTERDKARILEGIESATGGVDIAEIDRLVSGLGKRAFVLHSTKSNEPRVFTTRWVMSYLAGPLTRDQVEQLTEPTARPVLPSPEPPEAASQTPDDAVSVAPPIADGIDVVWTTNSVPWLGDVGAGGSNRLSPAAVATVHLRYDDRYAGVDHTETWEAVIHPVGSGEPVAVDHDARDFSNQPPSGPVTYQVTDADLDSPAFWRDLATGLRERLVRERSIRVWKNAALKLYSRVGETEDEFLARCRAAADEQSDADVAGLEDRYRTRVRAAKDAIRKAENRVRELQVDVDTRKQDELLSGAGDLLGALFGGRRNTSGLRRAASRRSQTRRTEERLDTAHDRLTQEQQDLVDLEADLADDLDDIVTKWDDAAADIEPVDIPLEAADVDVEPLRLVWIPVE